MTNIRNTILGIYNPFGSIITESGSKLTYRAAVEYFFGIDHNNLKNISKSSFSINSADIPKARAVVPATIELTYLHSLLTFYHERTHYCQLVSSPFGFFLFRSLNCQFASAQRLWVDLLNTSWVQSGNPIYIPLPRWLNWLSTKLPKETITAAVEAICRTWTSFDRIEASFFLDYITSVDDAIDDLHRLRSFQSKMMNQYFPDFSHIIEPRRVNSRLNINSACVPHRCLTTLHIIESYAKTIEFIHCAALNVSEQTKQSYLSNFDSDLYLGAVHYIMEKYPGIDTTTILAVLDFALFSPADTIFQDIMSSKELTWEDLHPGFRVHKILQSISAKKLRADESNLLLFYDTVSDLLHWPLASDLLNILNRLSFVDISFQKAKQLPPPIDHREDQRSILGQYVFELIRQLSRLRFNAPKFPINPYGSLNASGCELEPFLTLCSDGPALGNSLGFDEGYLLIELVGQNLFPDLFSSDNLYLTTTATNIIASKYSEPNTTAAVVDNLTKTWLFLPRERIKSIWEMGVK